LSDPHEMAHKWSPICPPARGLVRPVRMDPSGSDGPTRGQAQRARWRPTSHGFYIPAEVDPTRPEQRVMEQSVRLPEGSAITGWAACRLFRANFFDGIRPDGRTLIPVPLALGDVNQVRADKQVTLLREPLDRSEMTVRYGITCARHLRALFDEARCAENVREATVAIDMMAAAEQVSINQFRRYVEKRPGWRGVAQVRQALDLADERSMSPNETRMRMIWRLEAGFPRPLVNQPVFDRRGRLAGVADLLDVEAGVVGEYDGADHRAARRHSKDVAREEFFRGLGLEYFKVVGPDMRSKGLVPDRMASSRARAKWLTDGQRRWTIEPPPDWPEEPSLDVTLALRELNEEIHRQIERDGNPDPVDLMYL